MAGRKYTSPYLVVRPPKDRRINLRPLVLVYHFYGSRDPPLNSVTQRDLRELYWLLVPGGDLPSTYLEPSKALWALRCRIKRKFRWIEGVNPSGLTRETAEIWFAHQVGIFGLWHPVHVGNFSEALRAEVDSYDPAWRP